MDVRALEEALADALDCLYVEVVNEANLTERSENGGMFDRAALERLVFCELAKEAGAADAQGVSEVVAALKNGLLSGETLEAMLDYLCGEAAACESNP